MKSLRLAHKQTLEVLERDGCDNWSLFFDKFAARCTPDFKRFIASDRVDPNNKKEEPNKPRFLREVVSFYRKNAENPVIRNTIAARWSLFQAMADEHGDRVRLLYFRNTTRLIVQMARSNILENTGVSFERITGMPMVNGTGLKGAVSTWAIWQANGEETVFNHPDRIRTDRARLDPDLVGIFGDNSGNNANAGKIVFYGLFPLEVPKLGLDILTPHQGRVLPNPFLVIEPGTTWLCPLRLMRGGDLALLEKAAELVAACLTQTGLGAKTAAGYGRFERIAAPEIVAALAQEIRKRASQIEERLRQAQKEAAERREFQNLAPSKEGMARFASMSDQEFVTFVNQFQFEDGFGGRKWPGTLQEQFDLFCYCRGEGQSRLTGKKQKKAFKNLSAKFEGRGAS